MEKPGVLGCVLGQESRLPCVGKSEGLIDATARGTHSASAGSAVAAAGDDIAAPVCRRMGLKVPHVVPYGQERARISPCGRSGGHGVRPYGNPGTLVPGGDGVGLAASLRVLRPRPQLRGPAVRWGNAEVVSGRYWRVVLGHASATGVADAEPGGYR